MCIDSCVSVHARVFLYTTIYNEQKKAHTRARGPGGFFFPFVRSFVLHVHLFPHKRVGDSRSPVTDGPASTALSLLQRFVGPVKYHCNSGDGSLHSARHLLQSAVAVPVKVLVLILC
jgi:hypothetical protein